MKVKGLIFSLILVFGVVSHSYEAKATDFPAPGSYTTIQAAIMLPRTLF
ncbi:MAG: hypothetical protein AB1595_00740 [bacterium]